MSSKSKKGTKISLWIGVAILVFAFIVVLLARTVSAQGFEEMFRLAPGESDQLNIDSMVAKNIDIIPAAKAFEQQEDDYLLYIYSDKCDSCRKFRSVINEYQQSPDAIKLYALNEAEPTTQEFVQKNQIQGTPSLLRVQNSEESWRALGILPLSSLPKADHQ